MRLSHLLSNVSTIPESAAQSFTTGYDRQMVLEYAGYDSAEAEWFEGHKEIKERGIGFTNGEGGQVLQAWMWEWWAALKEWFDELEVDDQSGNILDAKKETVATDLRFIKVLQNSLIAKVAVVEVIREMGNSTINDGAKSIGLFIALGKAIENEWYAQTIKAIPELNQKLLAAIKTLNQENLDATASRSVDHTVRKIWKSELKNYQADLQAIHGDNFDWTIQQRSKVGALVMRGLLETSKITRSTVLEDGSV
jgi:DNA-directed RNA polymerase